MNNEVKEQLSALMDGELSRDETRFLMRRLDADTQLAKSWSNYQIASDVLKKRFATPMRADFAASVMQVIETERLPASRGGLLRWAGGGAIAAAVAVVALTGTRPLNEPAPPQNTVVAAATPVTAGVNTQTIEKQLSTGILPTYSPLDYTTAASYDQWLSPRANPQVIYPPLMDARPPQVIYFYAPAERPKQ
jgi:sigma-E factor negative regulatory protein RseA